MKDKTLGFTLGSDPEMMLFDTVKGRIVSSIPVLQRDKHNPIDLGNGAKMYADNVLVETAFPPATTKEGFITTLRSVLSRMQDSIGENYRLIPQSSHVYPEDELQDKSAKESGCNPNYDVYARTMNKPAPFSSGLRTGSFHIHVGHEKLLNPETKDKAIKLLDIYLGCGSVVFDRDDTSPARRALYGKAGEFRPTPYGVEYRVLGNFALRSPKTTELVVDLVVKAMEHIINGTEDRLIALIPEEDVVNSINNNMRGLAKSVLLRAGLDKETFARINRHYNPTFYKAWGL